MKKTQLRKIIKEVINEQIGNDTYGQQLIKRCPYLADHPNGPMTLWSDHISPGLAGSPSEYWTGNGVPLWVNYGLGNPFYFVHPPGTNVGTNPYGCGMDSNGFTGWPGQGGANTPAGHSSAQECLVRPNHISNPNLNTCFKYTKQPGVREIWCVVDEKPLTIPPPGQGATVLPKTQISAGPHPAGCPNWDGYKHNYNVSSTDTPLETNIPITPIVNPDDNEITKMQKLANINKK